jgi:ATP-dependent DNA ligase
VIARDDGTPDFQPFRSQRRGSEAVPFAFDLIEDDGGDLRDLPLIDRKRRLAELIGQTAFPKNWSLHNTPGALSVRERAALRYRWRVRSAD